MRVKTEISKHKILQYKHRWTVIDALMLLMHGTGLTQEADCAWCAPGKYQTGAGLVAEASCTWCVAGKYQSGSGLNTDVWLSSIV